MISMYKQEQELVDCKQKAAIKDLILLLLQVEKYFETHRWIFFIYTTCTQYSSLTLILELTMMLKWLHD